MRRGARAILTCTGLALFGSSTADAASTLVRFEKGPNLEPFARRFEPDERDRRDPDSWNYLSPAVKGALQVLESTHGFTATQAYSKVLSGFVADLSPEQLEGLKYEQIVASMTVTVDVRPTDQRIPWGVHRVLHLGEAPYEPPAGSIGNVTVYVIDSGIDFANPDLNVVGHVNFAGGSDADCNGHGTHVAGTIGARDNEIGVRGVAPGVPLVGVKVVDCSGVGTSAGIIKGLDWVASRRQGPTVVNVSLGGGASVEMEDAIREASALGLFVVIAAGNDATDACLSSPSSSGLAAGVLTVAAIDAFDGEAAFSNFGGCVDLWAPGLAILSTARGAVGATMSLSGTSMAAPHAAGAAALFLAEHPRATPADVEMALIGSSQIPGTASKDGRTILRLQFDGR
jgi:subtilisin family serine protease